MGSVALSVVGLPSNACAAAESACLQAVVDALTALLPPTAPAAKGGVAITKYYDSSSGGVIGTTFEASFAVLQAVGALVAVPATVRGGLAAGSVGSAALAANIAKATGSRATGLSVAVLSVQSVDYAGAGAGAGAGNGGGGSGGLGGGSGGGVTAGTVVLILLVVLQCVLFPAVLLKCYLRNATISLPPVLMSLFGLAPHSFNSLDEGTAGAARAATAAGGAAGAGSGGGDAACAAEAVVVAPADVAVAASAGAEAATATAAGGRGESGGAQF